MGFHFDEDRALSVAEALENIARRLRDGERLPIDYRTIMGRTKPMDIHFPEDMYD